MDARAALQRWRERGDDGLSPLRFAVLEAMERRLAQHQGAAHQLLEQRLSELMDAYAHDLVAPSNANRDAPSPGLRGVLGEVVEQFANNRSKRSELTREDAVSADRYPELPLLHEMRALWTRMRTTHQLQESLQPIPADAGPLNSTTLVLRSLTRMREISPDYLQHFITYVDALSSLERVREVISPPKAEAARAAKRSAPRKPRSKS